MLLNDNNNLIKKVTFFYDSKNTNMAGPPSSQSELSYEHTYLGVTISDNLDWSKHITTTTTKANARLSFINWNLKDCPQKLKEIAYSSLVRSFVDYESAVWDPHQKFNQEKLEMVC